MKKYKVSFDAGISKGYFKTECENRKEAYNRTVAEISNLFAVEPRKVLVTNIEEE